MKKLPILFSVLAFAASSLHAEDWPKWLGPRGDSTWNDTGLITKFPAEGAKVLWRAPIANGYSGPAVSGGKVYATDFQIASGKVDANPGGRTAVSGTERIVCLDEKTGEQKWEHHWKTDINLSFPNGPRCSPVVDGGTVFALGAEGHLAAVNAADGKVLWEKELKKEYKCESPLWGYAAIPLVHGDLVYTLAGGPGTAAVALDRKTGKEVWRALDTKDIGYAPPVLTKRDGKDELLIWLPNGLNGLDPATGKVHWSQPYNATYGMSIMTPRVTSEGVFVGSMQKKSMMVKPGKEKAEVIWEGSPNQALAPKNGTPVVVGDFLYGCDTDGELRCFKAATGERLWSTQEIMSNKKVGSGTFFMARTPQQWVIFNDSGELILADLSPSGYKEASRAKILSAETPSMGRTVVWSHPAFANQCVFARNDKELICVSLAAK
ncbi:MAG TPA: PQQ-binding-like beta-propeller repeat protein [Verrucomicrobiales bacterium]|jgi:outer membrane protein assembly factor BamB|nr:PQQ-binding-like beta-propeller repeat protein [Verrucomicrobiales bacterium]